MPIKKNKTIIDTVADVAKPIEDVVNHVEIKLDKKVAPERKSAFKRYPKIFTLMVAFGVSAIYYGFENILDRYLHGPDHPFLVMMLGILILLFTGTIYKKL